MEFVLICVCAITININLQRILPSRNLSYHRNDNTDYTLVEDNKHLSSLILKIAQYVLLKFLASKCFLLFIDIVLDAEEVNERSHQCSTTLTAALVTRHKLRFIITKIISSQARDFFTLLIRITINDSFVSLVGYFLADTFIYSLFILFYSLYKNTFTMTTIFHI